MISDMSICRTMTTIARTNYIYASKSVSNFLVNVLIFLNQVYPDPYKNATKYNIHN